MADVTSLKNNLTRAQYTYDALNEKFNSTWGPAKAIERYEVGSPQYEAALKEYKKLKPQYERAKAELDSASLIYKEAVAKSKAEEKKKEDLKSTGGALDRAKKDYQRALDTEDPERIKTAKEALDTARGGYQAASKPKPVDGETNNQEVSPTTLEQDRFSEYTPLDGQVNGPDGPVIFVDKIDSNGNATPVAYDSRADARAAFLEKYKQPGQLDKLKQELLAANYIKQSEIANGSWIEGLDDMLIARSYKMVSEVKYGTGSGISIDDFLKTKKAAGGGSPTVYRNLSTRGDAKLQIDLYLTDLRGTPATDEEYESYYKQLHSEEMKQTSVSRDGTTTGDAMSDAERVLIAAKVARNSLRNMDVDSILSSGKGSQVAMDIGILQETAADYGVDMSAAEALKRVTNGIGQKDYLAKQQENIRQLAVTLHPYLKEHILAGGKVSDVANQYASIEYKKLGKPVDTATKSKRIMSAISRGVSLDQFDRELQNSDEWAFSDEAHSVADNFLSNLGRMWGRR